MPSQVFALVTASQSPSSVLNFFILKNLEGNQMRYHQMQKSPFSVGETVQVIQLLLWSPLLFLAFEKRFLKASKRDVELQSCPMWSPFREENFLSYQDEGIREKHQSSWNVGLKSG